MTQPDLNRRQFLTVAAGGAAGLPLMTRKAVAAANAASPPNTATTSGPAKANAVKLDAHPMSVDGEARAVLEAPRRTPIAADVDVLVVGGGPAGAFPEHTRPTHPIG